MLALKPVFSPSLLSLTQDHRVLAHDSHGEGALSDGFERVLDLEPATELSRTKRERERERESFLSKTSRRRKKLRARRLAIPSETTMLFFPTYREAHFRSTDSSYFFSMRKRSERCRHSTSFEDPNVPSNESESDSKNDRGSEVGVFFMLDRSSSAPSLPVFLFPLSFQPALTSGRLGKRR